MLDYNNFILESYVERSINEGRLIFSNRFIGLLTSIDSPVAHILIDSSNNECDVNANYIDVGSKSDTASFIQENRLDVDDIKFKVNTFYRFCNGDFAIVDRSGFSKEGLVTSLEGMKNEFRLIDSTSVDTLKMYRLQFLENESKYVIVYQFSDDVDPVISTITDLDGQVDIKIGRLVNKVLTSLDRNVRPNIIEDFVNKYKAAYDIFNNVESGFKVVNGEDIRKYYLNKNYLKTNRSSGSSLWKSCMSFDFCEEYFDIYVNNPNKVSLLVLLQDDKVLCRALLWNLDGGDKFMDRIYSITDSYVVNFE